MKKILIIVVMLLLSGIVYAGVNTDLILPDGKVLTVYNKILGKESINMVKVIDGQNVCYITYIKYNNVTTSTSISCK